MYHTERNQWSIIDEATLKAFEVVGRKALVPGSRGPGSAVGAFAGFS